MNHSILTIESLGKRYRLANQGGNWRYQSLRDGLFQKKAPAENFWALQDVNLEIKPGERVGIIGRNGAGKTTLLKIISRITEPTTGKIRFKGRVASLLEVGTGFHPELTGRENIFLNGAIMGLSGAEIRKKFDEIVAFAEIEKFLDTPVKRYSSGMYVRLAFAVAAHLEPDILLVDEVLAVGDMAFQKKCLGKMDEVSKKQGRTILFVSHDLKAIRLLCSQGILMNQGQAGPKKPVEQVLQDYMALNQNVSGISFPVKRDELQVLNFEISQNDGARQEFKGELPIDVRIDIKLTCDLEQFRLGFILRNGLGDDLSHSMPGDWDPQYTHMPAGEYELRAQIPANFLVAGNYFLALHASVWGVKDFQLERHLELPFSMMDSTEYNAAYPGEKSAGVFLLNPHWSLRKK